MFPEEVFKERQEFAEKIATAPSDYLNDNATALMRIIWELQASLALELQVIQGIGRLDVADVLTVSTYLEKFTDYVEQRGFDLERTSCGRIADIYFKQIRDLEAGKFAVPRVPDLDVLLSAFASADRQFTEEIGPFMDGALARLKVIRDLAAGDRIADAKAQQDEFVATYRAEVKRLKAMIKEMNEVGGTLLERL